MGQFRSARSVWDWRPPLCSGLRMPPIAPDARLGSAWETARHEKARRSGPSSCHGERQWTRKAADMVKLSQLRSGRYNSSRVFEAIDKKKPARGGPSRLGDSCRAAQLAGQPSYGNGGCHPRKRKHPACCSEDTTDCAQFGSVREVSAFCHKTF